MHRSGRRSAAARVALAALVVVGTPIAVQAAPEEPVTYTSPIEPLAPHDGQRFCDPVAKPGMSALRALVLATYPGTRDSGISRDCSVGGTSEHKEGRAWDWALNAYDPVQDAQARDFLGWLLGTDRYGERYAVARRLGVMYVIYNRQIWSASQADAGWRPYTGASPHTDHVHISLGWPGAWKQTSFWSGSYEPLPPPAPPTGEFQQKWEAQGAEAGPLGAPVSGEYSVAGGRVQDFAGGRVYVTPTGAYAVYGDIFRRYASMGGHAYLGVPVTDEEDAAGGGRVSTFSGGGRIYWTPSTGAHAVHGAIGAHYAASGGPTGALGYPTNDEVAVNGGRMSSFTGGRIYWSAGTGARTLRGEALRKYVALGADRSGLGLPSGEETSAGTARLQPFQNGRLYWTGSGSGVAVYGEIFRRYEALGSHAGSLGLPTADEAGVPGGRMSAFQGGRIYWSHGVGARALQGPVLQKYLATGAHSGPLGLPASEDAPVGDGRLTVFTAGRVYTASSGATTAVYGEIYKAYLRLGAHAGVLGVPVADEADSAGARLSRFAGGRIYWTSAHGAAAIYGEILRKYDSFGGQGGPLGTPVADETTAAGARMSAFTGGRVYWTHERGAVAVYGEIGRKYAALGGHASVLGLPSADEAAAAGGRVSVFAGGRIYWSGSTGAAAVYGAIHGRYLQLGGHDALGLPTADEGPAGAGRVSSFERARIYWSHATGARPVSGQVLSHHDAHGSVVGFLGLPSTDPQAQPSWTLQGFQGGQVYVWAVGDRHVRGMILDAYLREGGPTGRLGLPTTDEYAVPGGRRSDFERGSITWDAASSKTTVTTG